MRIGGDGEATNAWNILGRAMNRAAGRFDARRIGVDIVDRDIARASSGIGISPPTIAGPAEKSV